MKVRGRAARTSWWRAIVDSAVAPASRQQTFSSDAEDVLEADRLAGCNAALAVAFIFLGLFVGLRPVSTELVGFAPAVVAATIIARALVSLGLFAIGLALLRMAERGLTGRRGR